MIYVDIHTHKSVDSNCVAVRNLTFPEAEELFASTVDGWFSVGFHPWHAGEFSAERMKQLTTWVADPRFIALGECGLDKNSKASFEVQVDVFEQQIALSEKAQKPMIIHCVGFFNELLALKKKFKPLQLWIIHGFRSKPELAFQLLKAGCALSFGEHFNADSVRVTPLDRLFVETDESQMSITEIYHFISGIKNCQVHQLNAGSTVIQAKNYTENRK